MINGNSWLINCHFNFLTKFTTTVLNDSFVAESLLFYMYLFVEDNGFVTQQNVMQYDAV